MTKARNRIEACLHSIRMTRHITRSSTLAGVLDEAEGCLEELLEHLDGMDDGDYGTPACQRNKECSCACHKDEEDEGACGWCRAGL